MRLFTGLGFLYLSTYKPPIAYSTAIVRCTFTFRSSNFGRWMVNTPCSTLAAIFSLSTSSGRMRVC